jgi:propanol-preferring alcohol dehydrogenase
LVAAELVQEIVHPALEHLRPGGTLAINAIHMSPIPELPYRLLYGERNLRSVTNFTAQDAGSFCARPQRSQYRPM